MSECRFPSLRLHTCMCVCKSSFAAHFHTSLPPVHIGSLNVQISLVSPHSQPLAKITLFKMAMEIQRQAGGAWRSSGMRGGAWRSSGMWGGPARMSASRRHTPVRALKVAGVTWTHYPLVCRGCLIASHTIPPPTHDLIAGSFFTVILLTSSSPLPSANPLPHNLGLHIFSLLAEFSLISVGSPFLLNEDASRLLWIIIDVMDSAAARAGGGLFLHAGVIKTKGNNKRTVPSVSVQCGRTQQCPARECGPGMPTGPRPRASPPVLLQRTASKI